MIGGDSSDCGVRHSTIRGGRADRDVVGRPAERGRRSNCLFMGEQPDPERQRTASAGHGGFQAHSIGAGPVSRVFSSRSLRPHQRNARPTQVSRLARSLSDCILPGGQTVRDPNAPPMPGTKTGRSFHSEATTFARTSIRATGFPVTLPAEQSQENGTLISASCHGFNGGGSFHVARSTCPEPLSKSVPISGDQRSRYFARAIPGIANPSSPRESPNFRPARNSAHSSLSFLQTGMSILAEVFRMLRSRWGREQDVRRPRRFGSGVAAERKTQ